MKISPVVGTPTIPQTQSSGLSIEKLQKIKSMAMGVEKEAPHEEVVNLEKKEPASNKVIKMLTNKNPEQPNAPQEVATETAATQEIGIPDAVVQTNPEPEATQQVSPQIAALAKQKRALQVKERELADKEKALEVKNQSRVELEQRVKNGQALSVLQDLGITYDQLTNELLGKQNAPDLSSVKEEILKSVEERFASKDTAQEEAVFAHMQKNVSKLSNSDNYPFIKAEEAQDKVLELIKRTWHEDGEVLDEEDALGLIEAELKEKHLNLSKILKGPEQTTQDAAETSPKPVQTGGIKTLTNKDSARPQSGRRQRSIAAFLGQK